MNCPSCRKETSIDSFFCSWCSCYMPAPEKGTKAALFPRWLAWFLEVFIAIALIFSGIGVSAVIGQAIGYFISEGLGALTWIFLPVLLLAIYARWFLGLFRQGQTPGKKLLGLRVIDHQTGEIPGFGKMFIREIVGRFISGLFFGLGYFLAIIDKNAQAAHDKIAGTVVVNIRKNPQASQPVTPDAS